MLQRIVANFVGDVRHDTMEGRQYLVAPMVMLTEGVHSGSKGPLFYPAVELSKTPAIWNHKPVVVYHPQANGQLISACDPAVLSSSKVGVIMNTKFEGGKLKAEAWMEESRIKDVDDRILKALDSGDPMELSTGLFSDDEDCEGTWNEEEYTHIARNYRPDHLALLPDKKGACSIADGAGLMVNELSHQDIRSKLQGLVGDEGMDSPWVSMVYSKYFVYEDSTMGLWKQSYVVLEEDEVELLGAPVEVEKQVKYIVKGTEDVIGNDTNIKESEMNKKEIIEELISNAGTAWSEDDKPVLLKMEKSVLEKMIPVVNDEVEEPVEAEAEAVEEAPAEEAPVEAEAVEDEVEENEEAVEDEAEASDPAANQVVVPMLNKRMTMNEFFKTAPKSVVAQVKRGMAIEAAEKKRLVNTITSNDACEMTEEFLMKKEIEELQAIAKLAANSTDQEDIPAYNYLGMGDPTPIVTNQEPLGLPRMDFSK